MLEHRTHSLRTYLILGLGSVVLVFLIAAVGQRAFVESRVQEQGEAQVRALGRYRAQQALFLVLLDEEASLRSYLATGDLSFLSSYNDTSRTESDALRTIQDNLSEGSRPRAQALLDRLTFLVGRWHDQDVRPLVSARLRGPLPNLPQALVREKNSFDQVKAAGEALQNFLDQEDGKRLGELDSALALAHWLALASYVGVVGAGMGFSRWLLKQVAAPLSELADQANAGDGFSLPVHQQPVKEVDILGRALYRLDVESRDREQGLRTAHEETLATREFEELVPHLSREEDLLQALDQALARVLLTTSQRILLRPAGSAGLKSAFPPMEPDEEALHPILGSADRCRAIHQASTVDLDSKAPTACLCPLGVPQGGSYLCIPLVASGQTVGLVNLQARRPGHWTSARRRMAETLVSVSAAALQAIRALGLAQEMSVRDALTGVNNRRFLDEYLPKVADQATRRDHALSLLMLDIDHFKAFNDEFGHEGGDTALRMFARCLQNHVRGGDVVARYGGEEFAIVMPEAGPEMARNLAERLRRTVETLQLPYPQFPAGRRITTSIGVASYPAHAISPGNLLTLADQALYQAKGGGRNRTVVAGERPLEG
jgi:diguanylate cyclase (GGDEF)-like protein